MVRRYSWMFIVAGFVLGLSISNLFSQTRDTGSRAEWEYTCAKIEKGLSESTNIFIRKNSGLLNQLAQEGWELVDVEYDYFFLKRKIR